MDLRRRVSARPAIQLASQPASQPATMKNPQHLLGSDADADESRAPTKKASEGDKHDRGKSLSDWESWCKRRRED